MEDNNRQQDKSSTYSDQQSSAQETQSSQQNNPNDGSSNHPLETGQTTGGGEDGNWKLTLEVREQGNSSADDSR